MKQQPEFLVVADASPTGVGAVLAAADASQTSFEPVAALKAKVTKEVASFLGCFLDPLASPAHRGRWKLWLWCWRCRTFRRLGALWGASASNVRSIFENL